MAKVRIPVSIEIREALKEIGPGDSYDSVIRDLIDLWIKTQIHEEAKPFHELMARAKWLKHGGYSY